MLLLHLRDALRRRHKAHQPDVGAAAVLQHLDRVAGAAARREHRIRQDDQALLDVLRKLAVIHHRLVGRLIAVQADVADLGHRHEGMQALDHAHARTQDGHDGELAAAHLLGRHLADRRLNIFVLKGKVPGHFIAHQQRDLLEQLAEILGTGLLVTHDGQLVLDHRVVDNMYLAHGM